MASRRTKSIFGPSALDVKETVIWVTNDFNVPVLNPWWSIRGSYVFIKNKSATLLNFFAPLTNMCEQS